MVKTNSNKRDDRAADELVEAARSYFASDFPNPQRIGCPPRETLLDVARSSGLPDDELRAHLFACSKCFSEFREALVLPESAILLSKPARSRLALSARRVFAFAAMIVLVALSMLIIIWLRQRSTTPVPTVAERGRESQSSDEQADSNQPAPSAPSRTENDKSLGSRSEQSTANDNSTPRIASNYREIELDSYTLYRGAGEQGGSTTKPIRLKASLNQLLFRLPEGSLRGRYIVAIKNSRMDQTIASANARSSDGKTLKAALDLRNLETTRYVLCITPEAHAPFCYEAIVR